MFSYHTTILVLFDFLQFGMCCILLALMEEESKSFGAQLCQRLFQQSWPLSAIQMPELFRERSLQNNGQNWLLMAIQMSNVSAIQMSKTFVVIYEFGTVKRLLAGVFFFLIPFHLCQADIFLPMVFFLSPLQCQYSDKILCLYIIVCLHIFSENSEFSCGNTVFLWSF